MRIFEFSENLVDSETKNLKNNKENEGFGELGVPKAVRMRIRHSIRSDNSFFKWCEALFSVVVCSFFRYYGKNMIQDFIMNRTGIV